MVRTLDFMDIDKVKKAVKASVCLRQVLRHMNYASTSTSYSMLRKIITDNNIDISHFTHLTEPSKVLPTDLCENSSKNTAVIKRYVLKHNLILYSCAICSLKDSWNNKKLVLRLDHINGDNSNNSLSNLRFVCPNCDSQLPTFAGRNRKIRSISNTCACGKLIHRKAKTCRSCAFRRTKIEWPTDSELLSMIKNTNVLSTAKELGVSPNTVVKRIKRRNLNVNN